MAELVKNEKLWQIWASMRGRCNTKSKSCYSNYGGRGIKVCKRWDTYSNFKEDMGSSFKEGLTIERIDVNGNYEPKNCKWATMKDQANNRRNNRVITYKGATKTLEQWINYLGLKSSTVRQRLYVYGWSVEKSFTYRKAGY